ncbi:MAG: DUF167 domain-containing protein [Candidatus Portnoybacteria bacterium]|nr:DUF167 domain-containing protein [Candidatus Portnoybacteria bacterium]
MKIVVNVKTNSKENKIDPPIKKISEAGKITNEYKIFVKEPAKEGKANEAIIKLLAKYFDIPRSKINIILGFKNKKKIISID